VSRFLFVVPPLAGHINPALSVAHAVAGRGHEVAWAGSEKFLRPLAGQSATIYRTGLRLYRPQGERGFTALKSLWESYLIPLARFTLPAVDTAVAEFQPDVLVVDQHAVAGAVIARKHGLRWATLAPTMMELARPYRSMPQVTAWLNGLLAGLCSGAGVTPFDPLFSPHLVLSFLTEALTTGLPVPDGVVMAGPVFGGRPAGPEFPWEQLDPGRKKVLVTVGTLATDIAADFYARMTEALEPLAGRVQAILVGAPGGPAVGPGILALPRVPLLDLMPHLDAVVSHGGINTVCEALSHGVPLLLAPIRHDQPVVAAQVSAAGAGLRVHFSRARPDELRSALAEIIWKRKFRTASSRIMRSFVAAGGAGTAAEHLERVAAAPASVPEG
jgi:UDP:flavonoid glycosyltransferase YjiC (YdhE family)